MNHSNRLCNMDYNVVHRDVEMLKCSYSTYTPGLRPGGRTLAQALGSLSSMRGREEMRGREMEREEVGEGREGGSGGRKRKRKWGMDGKERKRKSIDFMPRI